MKLALRLLGPLAAARRLAPELREHRLRLAGVLALSLAVAACQVALPWPMQWILDGALAPTGELGRTPRFWIAAGAFALLGLVLAQAAAEYAAALVTADVGQRVARSLRLRLFRHLSQLSPRFFARHKSGDLLVRLIGDVSMVRASLVDATVELATRSLWVAGTVVVMIAIDPLLSAALALVLPIVAWVVRSLSRRIETQSRKARRKEGALADFLQESLAASEVIQSLGSGGEVVRKLARSSRASERAGLKSARLAAKLSGSVHALLGAGLALALALGSWRVLAGSLSAGELLVFVSYVRGLLKPVRSASRNSEKLAKGAASAARVAEVLEEPVAVASRPGAPPAPPEPRELAFDRVSFRYDGDRDALRDFSARFARGELSGVFGRSGAGKSTAAALAVRLFDPDAGAVRMDGADLRELELGSVRERFGLCLQRPLLLGESVRENLALGAPQASEAEMWRALADAGVDGVVRALPLGLDTPLGAGGAGLSGGESRRVALARTLLRRAPILIVDEPFSGLDRAAAVRVLATLRACARGAIVIVIAHETELLGEYDRVVYVDAGRVQGAGAHAELLESSPDYRELCAAGAEVPA